MLFSMSDTRSAFNLPRSINDRGHKILECDKIKQTWEICSFYKTTDVLDFLPLFL